MRTWAVVVAAGSGSRFGAPKQFAELDGKPLVQYAIDAALECCEGVVVVIPPEGCPVELSGDVRIRSGGGSRSESVRAGLEAVPEDADIVVLHDAARPLASQSLFRKVVQAVTDGADGATPAVLLSDTVKEIDGDVVVSTLDRERLVAVQTPQAFRHDILRQAHADAAEATDDAALVERIGGKVVVVVGDPRNLKVTRPEDLHVAQLLARYDD